MPTLVTAPEREQEMLDMYQEGYTCAEIGSQFYFTRGSISRFLIPYVTPQLRERHIKNHRKRRLEAQLLTDTADTVRSTLAELMEAGMSRGDIMARLGVSRHHLDLLLADIDEDLRRNWQASRQRHRKNQYSHTEKITVLRHAAILNGGGIGVKRYKQLRELHPEWPSAGLYGQRGGWNWWLRQANIPTSPRPNGMGIARFTDEQYREAATRVAAILGGRAFSGREYDTHRRPQDPKATALKYRYGKDTWLTALEQLLPELM